MTGAPWPLLPSLAGLLVALLVVVVAGRKLTATADALADRTGLGEALAGALLLGAVTSLPGIGTTVVGSLNGDAEFALANPVGGIAVQTVWLAIGDLLDRKPPGLSGGEGQRVALGRALSFRPRVLCLDEPLSALDDDTRHSMIELLKKVQHETGVTALHVTHNQGEAEKLADCRLRLADRRVEMA